MGQEFDISLGDKVRRGTVSLVGEERVEFALGDELPVAGVAAISLYLAVFKFDRLEWAVEKCTELGVARITPIIARRTEAHLAAAAGKRMERWRKIALEAAQQSRRLAPPEIADPVRLKAAAESAAGLRIVLAENEQRAMLGDVVSGADTVSLAIGPEGGWTAEELELFGAAGWKTASLGATILRAETAAMAAVAIAGALMK